MEQEEQPQHLSGGIYNYFQGATIHNIVINGNMTKSGAEHYQREEHNDKPFVKFMGDMAVSKKNVAPAHDMMVADYEEVDEDVEPIETEGMGLVDRLNPLFYNNEDDVRQFLKEIDGMKDNDITDLVNKWVKAKRISDYGNSRKGVLWGILHQAGLYKRTVQNWNRRVD